VKGEQISMNNNSGNNFNTNNTDNDAKKDDSTVDTGTNSVPASDNNSYTDYSSNSSVPSDNSSTSGTSENSYSASGSPVSNDGSYRYVPNSNYNGSYTGQTSYTPNNNVNNYYSPGNNYNTNYNSSTPGSSYTWSNQQQAYQQPYTNTNYGYRTGTAVKTRKNKSGGKVALKIIAVVLCCLLVSGTTVGIFVMMIQNGTIAVNSGSSSTGSGAAFTITKLVSQSDSSTTTTTTTGSETKLSVSEAAAKVIPSVVCVENYQTTTTTNNFGFGNDASSSSGSDVSPYGEGSGVIYSSDGYILTNWHVVDGATSLKVITYDGTTYEAKLIGSDSVTDLAVIKIDATGLTPAEFGSSSDCTVGDQVLDIGNPGGEQFSSSVTVGYISALNREVTNSDTGYTMTCIQTDAAINPGNSGGALVNLYGQVIGIPSSKIVSTSYEGLGFAIPIDTAQPIITELMNYGYVKDRAMLGISGTYIDSMTAQFYGLSEGMYVSEVTSTLASQAGVQKGDVITAIDGTAVTSSTSITTYLLTKKPGDTVVLTIDRYLSSQTNLSVTVTLTENTGSSSSESSSSESSSSTQNQNPRG
jgi:serine protease Do